MIIRDLTSPALLAPETVTELLGNQRKGYYACLGMEFGANTNLQIVTARYIENDTTVRFYYGGEDDSRHDKNKLGLATAHIIGAAMLLPADMIAGVRQNGLVVANKITKHPYAQAFAVPAEGRDHLIISQKLYNPNIGPISNFRPVAVVY